MSQPPSEDTPESALATPIGAPERRSDDEIRAMAQRVLARGVFHGGMMEPSDAIMVFLPMAFIDWSRYDLTQWAAFLPVGILGVHSTTGMQINGFPTFVEFSWWHIDDLNAAIEFAQKIRESIATGPVMRQPPKPDA